MGIIADACAKQGHGVPELAAFCGMLGSLLTAMDTHAQSIPDDIMAALDNFCVAREIYLCKAIESLEFALSMQTDAKAAGVVIEYESEEDYPQDEVLPRLVKNHFQSYAATHLPKGLTMEIVPFDGAVFRDWLKGAQDTQETRLLWAANMLKSRANP